MTFDVKPHSKYEASLEAVRYGTSLWDYKTTHDFLGNSSGCTESNPLMGKHPSDLRLLTVGASFEFGLTRLDNFLQARMQARADRIAATTIVNLPVALLHAVAASSNSHCR